MQSIALNLSSEHDWAKPSYSNINSKLLMSCLQIIQL